MDSNAEEPKVHGLGPIAKVSEFGRHQTTMYQTKSVGLQLALAVDLVHVRFSYFLSTAIKERS